MTARFVTVGMMLTAAMIVAIPAEQPAQAASNPAASNPAASKQATGKQAPGKQGANSQAPGGKPDCCACNCIQPRAEARPVPRPAPRRAAMSGRRGQAYAEGFYNYYAAAPVSMTGWHGEWRRAPNDWVAPPAYADGGYPAAYGPPPEQEGLQIDRGGWSGGVGNFEGGGGGGGGMGIAILAQGGGGLNGPTYNDFNQSFQNNPSVAGPFHNRLMGGLAPPPAPSGSGSK